MRTTVFVANTSPWVCSIRPRVSLKNARVLHTRGCLDGTHGDVLNVPTGMRTNTARHLTTRQTAHHHPLFQPSYTHHIASLTTQSTTSTAEPFASVARSSHSQRARFDKTVVDAQGQWLTVNDQRSLTSQRRMHHAERPPRHTRNSSHKSTPQKPTFVFL